MTGVLVFVTLTILVLSAAVYSWLLILFLGNLGIHLGFWGAVPGGMILVSLTPNNSTVKQTGGKK